MTTTEEEEEEVEQMALSVDATTSDIPWVSSVRGNRAG
jgi:hypothetical protein